MKEVIKWEGLDILQQQVKRLVTIFEPPTVEPVLKQSAEMVTAEVQRNVDQINEVSGNLRRSPVTKQLTRRYPNPATALAAIDRKIAPHAHFLEDGTGGRGGQMPAQPFFRPAVEATREKAIKHVYDTLKGKLGGLGQ